MQLSDLITESAASSMRACATAPTKDRVQIKVVNFVNDLAAKIPHQFYSIFKSDLRVSPHGVMVCVMPDRKLMLLSVRKDRRFARHVGELLKQGSRICWAEENRFQVVSWENWKIVYLSLTEGDEQKIYDPRMSAHELNRANKDARREEMFYECTKNDRYKKPGKRGFNMAFNEMQAFRRQEIYERRLFGTIREAKKIIEKM